MNSWFIYLVRTARGTLYTGITRDVARRFAEHSAGGARAAKALRGRGPLKLEFQYELPDQSSALIVEAKVKKWRKAKKEALVRGEIAPLELLAEIT
ncbi:UPF0213 protein BH0048 [Microbulbifer aestuariivivens]|uniref:UPF0213 protein BH0048 n=1 Tax=Microbulbifer aestuariivivens TaxID=1908308 RepID=A0ABP9WLA0_9GAMM